ncbi:hypothetical protein BDV59DRAFT_61425 [Aspergillus ambiguus]|uniref:uncharacterized protein n=1 Tax=Aspergillus ambiguus TaxID=176160 RepID=UPI003CCD27FE
MIPPCDPTILENNPQFKKLYQHLKNTLLNPDGSSRAHNAEPDRKAVVKELKGCRVQTAKKQIKKRTLRRLAFDPDSGLPDDSRDNVAIVTLYLDSSRIHLDLDNDARDTMDVLSLLGPDIDAFYSDMPSLILPFSRILSADAQALRLIADAADASDATAKNAMATESSRPRHRSRQSMAKLTPQVTLSSQLSERIQKLRRAQLVELPAARTRMAATAAEVLAMRAAVLEQTVTLLERAKHGALARATKAKAEHLAMVAQGVEGKLSVMQLEISNTIHTPEVTAALGRYREHLRGARENLEEQHLQAQEELDAYAAADSGASSRLGSGPVGEIARRYGGLIKEIEGVRMEIHRLES